MPCELLSSPPLRRLEFQTICSQTVHSALISILVIPSSLRQPQHDRSLIYPDTFDDFTSEFLVIVLEEAATDIRPTHPD